MANRCLPSTQLFEPGSRQAPLPSMLMAIPFLIRTAVNAVPVNWLP